MLGVMFSVEITIRDYECDQQGIVNNAVYLNYFQHARHEFGRSVGLDWLELTERGIDMVLRRAELDYFRSLRPGMRVRVTAKPVRKGKYRFYFEQEILILPGEETAVKALMTAACVVDGRPAAPVELDRWFGPPN
jgi:acyl-CoA thioester hydrolase